MNYTIKLKAANAIKMAVTGRHSIVFIGKDLSELNMYCDIIKECSPKLGRDESLAVAGMFALHGNPSYLREMRHNFTFHIDQPWREPEHDSTLEYTFGGGPRLRAGEVSYANNGVLCMRNITEYKPVVLSMMRAPMETRSITLARAGRSKIFPADFQLAATMKPCPCGNFGMDGKVCLCRKKEIQEHRDKVSEILKRCDIICSISDEVQEETVIDTEDVKEAAMRARETQKTRRGMLNCHLSYQHTIEFTNDAEFETITSDESLDRRDFMRAARVAFSVKDWRMKGCIEQEDYDTALEICGLK